MNTRLKTFYIYKIKYFQILKHIINIISLFAENKKKNHISLNNLFLFNEWIIISTVVIKKKKKFNDAIKCQM